MNRLLILFFSFLLEVHSICDEDMSKKIVEFYNDKKFMPIKFYENSTEKKIIFEVNEVLQIRGKYAWYSNFFYKNDLASVNFGYILIFKNNNPFTNVKDLIINSEVSMNILYEYNPIIVYDENSNMVFVYILENKDMIFVTVEKTILENINSKNKQTLSTNKYIIKNILIKNSDNIRQLFYKIRNYNIGNKIKDTHLYELKESTLSIKMGLFTYYYIISNEPHEYNQCHKNENFINKMEINIMYIVIINNKTNIIEDIIYKPYCCS